MTTAVAATMWSRMTAFFSAENIVESDPLPLNVSYADDDTGKAFSYEQVGLIYPTNDTVMYIRRTARKSIWLYAVLAIQPLLTIIMFGLVFCFYSVPVDRGFGLVSILSGLDDESRDSLNGAALSGELEKKVKLVIHASQDENKGAISYQIEQLSSGRRNTRISPKVIYS